MKIEDIMRKVVQVSHNDTLEQAVEQMTLQDVNSVLVVDDSGSLIGSVDVVTLMNTIIPEYIGKRDMSVATFATESMFEEFIKDNKDKKVKYFMLETPKTLKTTSTIMEAAIKTTEGRQSRIPVLDETGKPVGVVTRQWVKKFLATKMGFDTSKCY